MKVQLADKAGFCFGVRRAMDTVQGQIGQEPLPVTTYGPIIHNEEVIRELEEKGVRSVNDMAEARRGEKGTMIIRSHGVTAAEEEMLKCMGYKLVDATCPFVKKIHKIVREHSLMGEQIIIVGARKHPEVQGIAGWSAVPRDTYIIETAEEVVRLPDPGEKKRCIVSQTTFNLRKFEEIVEKIKEKGYDRIDSVNNAENIVIYNTICSATRERQEAAAALSREVDAMIVIGGMSSSNTRKLYEICSEHCQNTYFVQTKDDLEPYDFSDVGFVGITAGASTPNNIIEEVQRYVRNE